MNRHLTEESGIPLYLRVYRDLDRRLGDGEWVTGDRLPSEAMLTHEYECSLITVRRALDELARQERITRQRGQGTFVSSPKVLRNLSALTSFTEEMHHHGLDPQTQVIAAGEHSADAAVAQALNLELGAPILYLERLRSAGGFPLLLEQVSLPAELFPGLLGEDLGKQSLYAIITKKFGVALVRASEVLEPVIPTNRQALLLGQQPRDPALEIHLTAYTHNDLPVEYCRTLVRGDRAKYHVEIGGLTGFEGSSSP